MLIKNSNIETLPLAPDNTHYDEISELLLAGDWNGIGNWTGGYIDDTKRMDGHSGFMLTTTGSSVTLEYTFAESLDLSILSNYELLIWIDNPLQISNTSLRVTFHKTSGEYANINLRPRFNLGGANEGYYRVRFPRSGFSYQSGFTDTDWASVDKVSFSINCDAGDTVQCALITLRRVKQKGIVTINFDDWSPSVYNIAFPIMRKYNVQGAFYVMTSEIGKTDRVTSAQLQKLYNNGWDIGNHTHTHPDLTTLTENEVRAELATARQILLDLGFYRSCNLLATPSGTWSSDLLYIFKDFINFARFNAGWNAMVPLPAKWGEFPIAGYVSILNTDTVETTKTQIDKAKQEGLWYNPTWHYMNGSESSLDYDAIRFEEIIQYLAQLRDAGQVDIKTPSEVLMQIKNQDIYSESAHNVFAVRNKQIVKYPIQK